MDAEEQARGETEEPQAPKREAPESEAVEQETPESEAVKPETNEEQTRVTAAEAAESEATEPAAAEHPSVDDEPEALQLFARMLSSSQRDYRILQAANGQRALSLLRERQPDAMLLDLIMPGMDGFQVLQQKSQDPSISEIPVIVISSRDPRNEPIVSDRLAVTCGGGLSARDLLACIQSISEALTPSVRCADYNQAMMDLGSLTCTRGRPACKTCPLVADCIAHRQGNPGDRAALTTQGGLLVENYRLTQAGEPSQKGPQKPAGEEKPQQEQGANDRP